VFVWFDADKQWVAYGLGVKDRAVLKIGPGLTMSDAVVMPRTMTRYDVADWHAIVKAFVAGKDVALRSDWCYASLAQKAFVSLDEDGMRAGRQAIIAAADKLPEIPEVATPAELKEVCSLVKRVLVLFYRPSWCPHTKDLIPVVRKANALAAEQVGDSELRFATHTLKDNEDNLEADADDPLVRSLLEGQFLTTPSMVPNMQHMLNSAGHPVPILLLFVDGDVTGGYPVDCFLTAQTILSTVLDLTPDAQLEAAIRSDRAEGVAKALAAGAGLERVALQGRQHAWRFGCTPFLMACALCKPDALNALVEAGSRVGVRNFRGQFGEDLLKRCENYSGNDELPDGPKKRACLAILEKAGGLAFGQVYSKTMSDAGKAFKYKEVEGFPAKPEFVHFPKLWVDGGWRCDVGDDNGYIRNVTLEEMKAMAIRHQAIGFDYHLHNSLGSRWPGQNYGHLLEAHIWTGQCQGLERLSVRKDLQEDDSRSGSWVMNVALGGGTYLLKGNLPLYVGPDQYEVSDELNAKGEAARAANEERKAAELAAGAE